MVVRGGGVSGGAGERGGGPAVWRSALLRQHARHLRQPCAARVPRTAAPSPAWLLRQTGYLHLVLIYTTVKIVFVFIVRRGEEIKFTMCDLIEESGAVREAAVDNGAKAAVAAAGVQLARRRLTVRQVRGRVRPADVAHLLQLNYMSLLILVHFLLLSALRLVAESTYRGVVDVADAERAAVEIVVAEDVEHGVGQQHVEQQRAGGGGGRRGGRGRRH